MSPEQQSLIDLNDKVVLVTGGTGSFGRRFIERVLRDWKPRKLIILSRDEHKQFDMQQDPRFRDHHCLRFFIGDVRDKDRLTMAMRDVDYVVHAAALKHVPIAEYNPFECIHTNVYGAENVVSAALNCGVKRVVALSTDKAVNPINIYGASKLAADKIFIAGNVLAGSADTRFSVVRYGNVLGSRGSVIPYFRRLVADGAKSLPITDERMTRFWVTLDQGIDITLDALAAMRGGEIFVRKVPSMRIVELAEAVAPGVAIHKIGIRPGEKLHEVLITEDETAEIVDSGGHFIICPELSPETGAYHKAQGGNALAERFRYTSDNNDDWLDADALRDLISLSNL
jgi:UDP-N-acetylglucosamine 4,6-dehydratase/5-epimerase